MNPTRVVAWLAVAAIWTMPPDPVVAQNGGFELRGQVTRPPAGRPASGATVTVRSSAADTTLGRFVTEADGTFRAHLSDSLISERLGPSLLRVYPNPAGRTDDRRTVAYAAPETLAAPGVRVFDVLGRRVPSEGVLGAGVYFVQLRFPGGRTTRAEAISMPVRSAFRARLERTPRRHLEVELRADLPGHGSVRTRETLSRRRPSDLQLQLSPRTSDERTDGRSVTLHSPEEAIAVTAALGPVGERSSCLYFSVRHRGDELIAPSALGLTTAAGDLRCDLEIADVRIGGRTQSRRLFAGPQERTERRFRAMEVELHSRGPDPQPLILEVRAFAHGWALRYRLPGVSSGPDERLIRHEHTSFAFPAGTEGFFHPKTQDPYVRQSLRSRRTHTRWPLTLRLPDDRFVSILEVAAAPHPWADLMPRPRRPNAVQVRLASSERAGLPWTGPWRTVIVGEHPTDLIDHRAFLDLLVPPRRLRDTTWIEPGTAMRVTNPSNPRIREHLQFALRERIDYLALDGGWYGPPDRADPSTPRPGLDIPEAARDVHARGLELILYVHHRALDRPIEELFARYREWGVDGVKLGFVPVRTQEQMAWLYRAVRAAARHELVLLIHDSYVPQGITLTYPHVLTVEGVRGNENWPTARQNTILPFTRGLAGPTDYTMTYDDPRQKTTNAHQLALGVALFSPMSFLYWYQTPSELEGRTAPFFRHLPTRWNETRAVEGTPGRFVTIARRRGSAWFVGGLNGERARRTDLELTFLDPDRSYVAYLYTDAHTDASDGGRAARLDTVAVDADTVIREAMKANGGIALRIIPVSQADHGPPPRYEPSE